MSAAELKNDLIKIIINTDDMVFLQQVKDFFKKHKTSTDWWEEISDQEKEMIERGLKDVEERNVVAHEDVRKGIDELLHKN